MARQDSNRPRATVEDIVKAHGGLTLRGSQWEGACLCCGGDNRFHVNVDPGTNGDPTLGCRQCDATFTDHLKAHGLLGNGAGGLTGIGKRALAGAAPVDPRPYEPTGREGLTRDWTCTGPGGTAHHSRHPVVNPDGTTGKVVTWPDGGAKTKRLLYGPGGLPLPVDGRPVVITEGEVDADAAHGRGLLALATVCGEATAPDVDVLAWAGLAGRDAILWPDRGEGAGHMHKVAANLAKLTPPPATVHVIDPARLELKWTKGAGCADWLLSTDADPLDELRGAAAPWAPPAPPVQRPQKKAGGGKVEKDRETAPATAVVGDQEGAAEERARILAGLPEDLIDPCDAVLRGGRAIRLATLAALAGSEAWKNADTDLRLDVKARLESYVHAQLFERFLGHYDKKPEDWIDPLRVQADEDDEEVVLGEVDADEAVDAVLDGLAWKNTLSIFASRAKTGKTTFIVDRLAAAFKAGRVPKLALIYSEMSSARMRHFCNLRGFQPEWLARVKVSKIKNVQKCVKRIKALDPDFVLVDSLTPLVVASGGRPGSLWDPIVSRSVLQPLADTGACVLTTHHTRKEDGALRDSGDIEAGVDMIITTELDDPKSDRPKIVGLRYNGRWEHPDEELEFVQAEARYQKRTPSGNTPGGGTLDPFHVRDPLAPVVEFAQGWLMQNPEGGKRAYRDAARAAGHRRANPSLDAALDRARNQNPLPPGTAGTPPLNTPCPAVPSSGARSGHGAGHGAGHAVPGVPGPIAGTVPGTVPGARLPGTGQVPSEAPVFDPAGAFNPATPTPATPGEDTTMPTDRPPSTRREVEPLTPPTSGPVVLRTPMPGLMPDGSVNPGFEWLRTATTWEGIRSATAAIEATQAAAWRRVRGES
jgi:hypothetical protein